MAQRGQSYWSFRRRIRKDVAALMSLTSVVDLPAECELQDDFLPDDELCSPPRAVSPADSRFSSVDDTVFSADGSDQHYFEQSSSDESDDARSRESDDVCLHTFLASWASSFNISHTALTALLRFLSTLHPSLPLDARTLLRTPRTQEVRKLTAGGELWYSGIAAGLEKIFTQGALINVQCSILYLQLNVDGLPLFKSCGLQLWPIVCKLIDVDADPFIVALFSGFTKPNDLADYLAEFIEESKALLANGICFGESHFRIVIHSFVCDAPARAFLKCVKGHNSYSGCERCSVHGIYENHRMVFLELEAEMRTDHTFRFMIDDDHHIQQSPLAALPIDMVSRFVLDPMHLLYLGVMRRMLSYWTKGPLTVRLQSRVVNCMSEWMINARRYIPREFARKSRSISEMERWKATEFKLFLLYCGAVVLHTSVPENIYHNFLILFVACRILSSPKLEKDSSMCNYAESLLKFFVQDAEQIYGREFVVYNVHSLIHLTMDVRTYGSLDAFSAFPFENKLKSLKKMVRKPQNPLHQIVRRLTESSGGSQTTKLAAPTLKQPHSHGPLSAQLTSESTHQYSRLLCDSFSFSLHRANNCLLSPSFEPYLLCNIVQTDCGNIVFLCKKFEVVTSFFDYPVQSEKIHVFKVTGLRHEIIPVAFQDVLCKCIRLPVSTQGSDGHFVVMPLLHQC